MIPSVKEFEKKFPVEGNVGRLSCSRNWFFILVRSVNPRTKETSLSAIHVSLLEKILN